MKWYIKWFCIFASMFTIGIIISDTQYDGPDAINTVCSTPMTAIKDSLGTPILADYQHGVDAMVWTYVGHQYTFIKHRGGCRIYGSRL